MKRGRQKRKAYSHEKQVAAVLAKAYYPGGEGTFMRRDSLLGIRDKSLVPGDLVAVKYVFPDRKQWLIDTNFPFAIECKHYNDETLKHFFSGLYCGESQIFNWVEQASHDADVAKKIPVVVFRLFRTEDIAILRKKDFADLEEVFGTFEKKSYELKRKMTDGTIVKLVFVLLKDLLSWVDFETFIDERSKADEEVTIR